MELYFNQKKSLRRRIFVLSLSLVAATAVLFSLFFIFSYFSMRVLILGSNEAQNNAITDTMTATTQQVVLQSYADNIRSAAALTDGELWSVLHDVSLLAEEVEKILMIPGPAPGRTPIHPPRAINEGELSLQILYANYRDPQDPVGMEKAKKVAQLSEMMKKIITSSEMIHDIVVGFPEGISLTMDPMAVAKLGPDGEPLPYDVNRRPWYAGAELTGDSYICPLNDDSFDDARTITAAVPVYVDGELAAVVGAAIFAESIETSAVESKLGRDFETCLINKYGNIVYSDRNQGELGMKKGEINNLLDSTNEDLVDVAELALDGESGCILAHVDGEDTYVAYAQIPTVEWGQFFFVPRAKLERTKDVLLDSTGKVFDETQKKLSSMFSRAVGLAIIISIIIFNITVIASQIIAGRLARPIIALNRAGLDFIAGKKTLSEHAPKYFGQVEIKTHDEVEELWYTLQDMEINIATSIRKIQRMASERERIEAELSLAANIQANMLPKAFSPIVKQPERFDIFASMAPAKEVGGDFYDFFAVDEDRVALVIADVSGKGVPAAMFMMMSQIFLESYGKVSESPKEVLAHVNNAVCTHNEDMMFVTVWFGILELSTGKVTAANAGHEYPALSTADGTFSYLKDTHGFVVGGMEDMDYEDYTFQMQAGDILFVYTDGVTEATNSAGELFGETRLLEALNAAPKDMAPKQLLPFVRGRIDRYVGGAPQFDDLTMLAVRYNGSGSDDSEG